MGVGARLGRGAHAVHMWGPPVRAIMWPRLALILLLVHLSSSKMVMDETSCHEVEEVEESRPVCSVKAMDSQHKPCRMADKNNINGCRRMIDCKIKKKMMKKPKEKKVCVKGKGEECFNVVKLEKQMEEKSCSFHPKTVCHPSRMKECRKVKKKMCNYLD